MNTLTLFIYLGGLVDSLGAKLFIAQRVLFNNINYTKSAANKNSHNLLEIYTGKMEKGSEF